MRELSKEELQYISGGYSLPAIGNICLGLETGWETGTMVKRMR